MNYIQVFYPPWIYFCVWCKLVIEFHFFAHSCPDLPKPTNGVGWRGCFCSILCSCLLCQILIYREDLSLFLGSLFCFIGLCACFYAGTSCFDDRSLVILFDTRYRDPSCFVLLSQNCCSYSESFMVPYEFLKCLFYICEICHGYSNRDCIESIHCFGWYDHFDNVNSSNPWSWYMLPFVCVFLNFFLQCCVVQICILKNTA